MEEFQFCCITIAHYDVVTDQFLCMYAFYGVII